MEAPICFEDIKTGKFCLLCEAKKRKGVCSDLDLQILRAMYKIDPLILSRDVEYIKSKEFGDKIYILARKQVGFFIGKNGKMIKLLENKFKKKFKIIAIDRPEKEVIAQILDPIKISTFSKVFKPDGSQEIRVRTNTKVPNKEDIQNLVSDLFGIKLSIIEEKHQ